MPASSTYFAPHDAHVDLFHCVLRAREVYFQALAGDAKALDIVAYQVRECPRLELALYNMTDLSYFLVAEEVLLAANRTALFLEDLGFPVGTLPSLEAVPVAWSAMADAVRLINHNFETEQAYFEDYDTWASENPDAPPSEYPVILVGCGEVWHGRTLVTEPVAPAVVSCPWSRSAGGGRVAEVRDDLFGVVLCDARSSPSGLPRCSAVLSSF